MPSLSDAAIAKIDAAQKKRLDKMRRAFLKKLSQDMQTAQRLRKLRGISDEEWQAAMEADTEREAELAA